MRTNEAGKVILQDYQTGMQKPITLGEYKRLKEKYISYHLEDCIGGNGLFRFSAKDDNDAVECVKMLNWNGIHKLKRMDPNAEKGYELIGIFHDHVWIQQWK